MNFSASIPVALMAAANAALESPKDENDNPLPGWGPNNFSVPAYAGAAPTHALLHCWNYPPFRAAVAAITGVVIQDGIVIPPVGGNPGGTNYDPTAMTKAVAQAVGAVWGSAAPLLTGTVTPGLYKDAAGVLWWVIQGYNTTTYPDPTVIPALIRRVRVPGVAAPWKQPIDQFDAYRLVNLFTGKPDECTNGGKTWVTTADYNVWQPGTQNSQWLQKGGTVPPVDEWPEWLVWNGHNETLYQVGAKCSRGGFHWISNTANNSWEPGVYGWDKQ